MTEVGEENGREVEWEKRFGEDRGEMREREGRREKRYF